MCLILRYKDFHIWKCFSPVYKSIIEFKGKINMNEMHNLNLIGDVKMLISREKQIKYLPNNPFPANRFYSHLCSAQIHGDSSLIICRTSCILANISFHNTKIANYNNKQTHCKYRLDNSRS